MRTRTRFLAIDDVTPGMVLAEPAMAMDHGFMGLKFPAGLVLTQESIDQLWAHQAEYVEIEEPDARTDDSRLAESESALQDLTARFSRLDLTEPVVAALFQQLVNYRSGL